MASNHRVTACVMLILLMTSTLTLFNVRPVMASEAIYIRANGSVDPPTAPIQRVTSDTYIFTANITDTTVTIERNNTLVDGAGYFLEGVQSGYGFVFDDIMYNVTLRRVNVVNFDYGICFNGSSHCAVAESVIKGNEIGIILSYSINSTITENCVEDNTVAGIILADSSSENTICKNRIVHNNYGVDVHDSSYNTIFHNNFINNTLAQAVDTGANMWCAGYNATSSGGNYWSNYTGSDSLSGPYQNETGSDSIGDTSYIITSGNMDPYPLMDPWIISPTDEPSQMIVGYSYSPSSLDPRKCYSTPNCDPILNVYEPLIFFDEGKTNQFVPRLAIAWEISEDGLNYTFTVRQGVKFHNGETLTAEDVEYSFERLLVVEYDVAWNFYEAFFEMFSPRDEYGNFTITGQQIDDAITRNGTTVTFHLVKPYPPFMQILAQPWSAILCKKWCLQLGEWPGTLNNWTLYNRPSQTAIETQNTDPPGPHTDAMCGTGPFMLDYYKKGVKLTIVKYDQYWGGWPATGSNGFLQRTTVKRIANWDVMKYMFLQGQLDHIQVSMTKVGEVLGQPGVRSIYPLVDVSCNAMFFTFNLSVSSPYLGVPGGLPKGTFNESGIPPDFFSDINVRKGFAYAFNYTKLIIEGLNSEACQPATPIIPEVPFCNPGQDKYSVDLTRAANCFAAAWSGQLWSNGFNFTICYNEGNQVRQKICEILKANVESLNSKFHIQVIPEGWSFYLSSCENHEAPIFQVGWLADYLDPHNFVYAFMFSNGSFPLWQAYSNATIDHLMDIGLHTTNDTARKEAYYELQTLYHTDCPNVPVYQPIRHRFEREWVQGWYYNPLFYTANYYYVQYKGGLNMSTRYSWPMFHQGVDRAGYCETPAPNTNRTQWTHGTGGVVISSPAVAGDKIYVGSQDGKVHCLDALSGDSLWTYTTSGAVSSSPAVTDGRVYVGSDDRNIYALNASDGSFLWNYTTGSSVQSSPAVANGRVYVGSYDNKLYCLNAYTGKLLWNYTTGNDVHSSPAVAYSRVYFGSYDGKLYCLDALSGASIWNYTTPTPVHSSPAAVEGKVYIGSQNGQIYCLDAQNGILIWNFTTGGLTSSPAVAYGKVYVGSYDTKLYCIDASLGGLVWNSSARAAHDIIASSVAVADEKVYVGSEGGYVYCFDAVSGAPIWNYLTGSNVTSSPAVADGVVYIGSADRTIYAFGNLIKAGDFLTIQEAIDQAPEGATVIIPPRTYNESIVINKTLVLIGKLGSSPVFCGGGFGIAITLLSSASGSIIAGIVITHWDQGILMIDSSNCKIYDNILSIINLNGIALQGVTTTNNVICSNIFQQNKVAVNVTASSTSNTIYKNIITSNTVGINLNSDGNVIHTNTIAGNDLGINMTNSNGNTIYHNNFADNAVPISITTSTGNAWDGGYPTGGNYWGAGVYVDQCNGPDQTIPGSDGINDTQYTVASGNNVDRYPLTKPVSIHDVGITHAATSKTLAGQGCTLCIELKVLNYGIYDESFTVSGYANIFAVVVKTIAVATRDSVTIILTWNTTGLAYGNYTLKIVGNPVQYETDLTDNEYTISVQIHVGVPGDVTGSTPDVPDGRVDVKDVTGLVLKFNARSSDQLWNPNYDVNDDTVINVKDITIAILNFMQHE